MTSRTINRALIVHKDIAIGSGTVVQTRGTGPAIAEQKIELVWIMRTLDEIRALDPSTYTLVALYDTGLPVLYYFDVTSTGVDDGDAILAPVPAISAGRWIKVGAANVGRNYATADFADITHPINTEPFKQAGFMAFNTTTNKPVWAVGSADGDVWVDATGATAHTPV